LLASGALVFHPSFVRAAGEPCVKIEPSELVFGPSPVVGRMFDVECWIYNVTNLYGVDIQIKWDTDWICYVDHTKMIPASGGEGVLNPPTIPVKDDVDETGNISGSASGTMYWLSEASVAPAAPFSGSGVAFTMRFVIVNQVLPGLTHHAFINFTSSVLTDANGNSIAHDSFPATIIMKGRMPDYPSEPWLTIDPHESFGEYARVFNLNIMLSDYAGLDLPPVWDVQNFNITLNYNTTLFQALSVTIDPDGWFASFWPNGISIDKNIIDNAAGRIQIGFGGVPSNTGEHVPPNGQGRLARITFNVTCPQSKPSGFTLNPTVIFGFPHPERVYPPWNGTSVSPPLPHQVENGVFYPLSADVNHDGVVDILDVVALASIYGCKEEDPKWNPAADVAAPYGVIDILDLVTVTSHYGQKYP